MKKKIIITALVCAALIIIPASCITWSGMHDRIGQADVALIMGNKVHPDGTPSPQLQGRLDRAVELYKQGCFPKIIVSGGTGKEGVPEGSAMKQYLIACGVPDHAIIVDDHGDDTRASAVHTAELMKSADMKSVFIITQFFHIPRSRLAMSKQGVHDHFHAHSEEFSARDIYSTLREVPAYLKYLMMKAE